MSLPGDAIVPDAPMVTDHAITIAARPGDVWPWLLQVGWHRGGWYTYGWVDKLLFPDNRPSAESILPEFHDLKVGDHIPDGAPETGCFFVVEEIAEERALVLHSTTHLPPQLLANPAVTIDWTWAFVLTPTPEGGTRLHFRCRAKLRPWWLRLAYELFLVPADLVMRRSMCLGLKHRAERGA